MIILLLKSPPKFERERSISVCLAAIVLRRKKFVWRFLLSKKNSTTSLLEIVCFLPHASRPSTSANDDNIEKVKKIVLENIVLTMNSFQRVKRSIGNTTWPFWGVYAKKFVVNGRICGQTTHGFFTTIMRHHIPAWLWLNFWLNRKQKLLLSHHICQIWLAVTLNIRSGERAISRLRT